MSMGMVAVLAGGVAAGACSDGGPTGADATVVTAVTPVGGAVAVEPTTPIEIAFSRSMMSGMEVYAALHRGTVAGPEVSGAWTWADDHMTLRFTPDAPLDSATAYAIHLGGGMMDGDGNALSYDSCLGDYGGDWVTAETMGGGMMGTRDMMGPGWRGMNGMYGVMFAFRTR